ncbi:TetR/AcrR family transcriptional regulator [Nesterenkonia alba]|uniref:TetR/AcrR family transcriptional regulator n=1 Tax=Nesterenkonia alba TaxID=515814 RepID=UPI0003B4B834|nr:TetR/AcrR family transcriptional regulator [Nesterenkonia alba]
MPQDSPRSTKTRQAVLAAAAELVRTRPYDELTVEGIAAASGVAKTTIYRRWRSKAEIALDAIIEGHLELPHRDVDFTEDLRADLLGWMQEVREQAFRPENINLVRGLLTYSMEAIAHSEEGGGSRANIWTNDHLERRLEKAIQDGEISHNHSVDVLASALSHTLAIRILVGTRPDWSWCEELVDLVIAGAKA